jgi:hypothetical protein
MEILDWLRSQHGPEHSVAAEEIESLRQQLSACQSDSKDAWIRVEDRLPVGQQDVLFGSPEWGWPVVGMYTEEMPNPWSEYDQINDKYIEWEAEPPTLWMPKPKLPQALSTPAQEP